MFYSFQKKKLFLLKIGQAKVIPLADDANYPFEVPKFDSDNYFSSPGEELNNGKGRPNSKMILSAEFRQMVKLLENCMKKIKKNFDILNEENISEEGPKVQIQTRFQGSSEGKIYTMFLRNFYLLVFL